MPQDNKKQDSKKGNYKGGNTGGSQDRKQGSQGGNNR
jgi:hypothetical protein